MDTLSDLVTVLSFFTAFLGNDRLVYSVGQWWYSLETDEEPGRRKHFCHKQLADRKVSGNSSGSFWHCCIHCSSTVSHSTMGYVSFSDRSTGSACTSSCNTNCFPLSSIERYYSVTPLASRAFCDSLAVCCFWNMEVKGDSFPTSLGFYSLPQAPFLPCASLSLLLHASSRSNFCKAHTKVSDKD